MLQLLGLFVTGIGASISALVAFTGRKTIVSSLALTMFITLTVAFLFCMNTAIMLINNALIMPAWLSMIAWFVPPVFPALFAALVSGHICRAAYDLALVKLQMVNSSS